MAVGVRCPIRSCRLTIDDADHWENAREKIRAHFRMEHPTKVLDEFQLGNEFVSWNRTLDDYFEERYGPGWANRLLADEQIVSECLRVRKAWDAFNSGTIQEAIERAANHGGNILPFDPQNPTDHRGNPVPNRNDEAHADDINDVIRNIIYNPDVEFVPERDEF